MQKLRRCPRVDKQTVAYYDKNSQAYMLRTGSADLSRTLDRFLRLVPSGGRVLDYGCGFGRDIRYFEAHELRVVGLDPSREFVEIARRQTSSELILGDVFTLRNQSFDGIWACASLLHVPSRDVGAVLAALYQCLAPGGAFYASVRLGTGEHRSPDGRLFVDYEPEQFAFLLDQFCWQDRDLWLSADADPQRRDFCWVNWLGTKPKVEFHRLGFD